MLGKPVLLRVQTISRYMPTRKSPGSKAGASAGTDQQSITLKTFLALVHKSLTQQQKMLKWVIRNDAASSAAALPVVCSQPAQLTSQLTRSFEKLQGLLQSNQLPDPAQLQRSASEALGPAHTAAATVPANDGVAAKVSEDPGHVPLKKSISKDLDEQYRLEKVIPFHPNSNFIKAYQSFWKKYLDDRMSFKEFACINPFYGEVDS